MGSTGSQARLIQSSHPPAHYQPVLMKDLGKHPQHLHEQTDSAYHHRQQSPKHDISVHAMFDGHMTAGGGRGGGDDGGCSGGGGVGSTSTTVDTTATNNSSSSDGDRTTDDDDGNEQTFTDSVMDRHLFALAADSLSMENRNTACDIVQYMTNLKLKHMEAEQQKHVMAATAGDAGHPESGSEQLSKSSDSSDPAPNGSLAAAAAAEDTVSSEGESGGPVVLDYKVDKGSTTAKAAAVSDQAECCGAGAGRKSSGSGARESASRLTSQSNAGDRCRSTGTSPVRIIKIKSPRNSIVDTSGKRLSIGRDRSAERHISPDRHSPRRQSEGGGGILKRAASPNPDHFPPAMGILKRCQSPVFRPGCVDRDAVTCGGGYTRRSLSPGNSIDSRSPRGSIDSRSPDRHHRSYVPTDQPHGHSHRGASFSPQSSFESRSSEPNLEMSASALAATTAAAAAAPNAGGRTAFDTRSPSASRKRSMSAHSSTEKSRHSEPYYHHYYQLFQQQQQLMQQQQLAAERKHQRQSKSLERTGSRDSTNSSSTYGGHGGQPDRVYHIGEGGGGGSSVTRSQSAENAYLRFGGDGGYDVRSNESLARAIEQPTCVECLYQRKPS